MELDKAAAKFVSSLSGEHWVRLDQTLQEEVLAQRGGLNQAAFSAHDLHRGFIGPLLDRAASCLAQYLPVTDVAQVEMAQALGDPDELARHMKSSLQLAEPLSCREVKAREKVGSGVRPRHSLSNGVATAQIEEEETTFLLLPASDAGKEYGEEAKKLLSQLQVVKVPGQADLMFCRERARLSSEELERMLAPCRPAYLEAASLPAASPHSRFDTRDWVPLEP